MTRKIKNLVVNSSLSAMLAISSLGVALSIMLPQTAHAVAPTVVYNALPSTSPAANYPSQPFQAQQTKEFGDAIHLGGTNRLLNTVTVT
ncbi:MAG TPA: hypothetical protein VFH39_04340, partial [Candidatus Saccharimonadales bacterium]|nr:hypothetical protein [Candidatus Saccharimonadales bacterium]